MKPDAGSLSCHFGKFTIAKFGNKSRILRHKI